MNYDKLIKFLSELSKNNNKEWFDANRPEYDGLRFDFENMVRDIILGIGEFDSKIKLIDPKKAMFRINRDIRFSKDKTPYKTNFSAGITNFKKSSGLPEYYFHIDKDGNMAVGGGMWNPDIDQLKAIRDHIVQQPESLEDIVYDKDFAEYFGDLDGDSLVRVPRGYDETNPLIKYIKLKRFTVFKEFNISNRKVKDPLKKALEVYKEMYIFIDWLREAVA
ncbi:MAG: DUF2461 domain-containing protein [Candidatus Dojkabacteria bacterium]